MLSAGYFCAVCKLPCLPVDPPPLRAQPAWDTAELGWEGLPGDLLPCLLQAVDGIALQGREDGVEGGEILEHSALLGIRRGHPVDEPLLHARKLPEDMPGTLAHTATQVDSARSKCTPGCVALRSMKEKRGPQAPPIAYPGHFDPVFHHPGPVRSLHTLVSKAGSNNTVGHIVELGDSGADGRREVLLALLVPLGPDGAQAVVGHDFLE